MMNHQSPDEKPLPPHLKIAATVSDEEYETAKRQSRVILFSALAAGIVVTGVLILFVTGAIPALVGGGISAIGVERLLDQLLPEGKKMRTQRMKVYPELRNYRNRQQGS